jgi:hypothetical protein
MEVIYRAIKEEGYLEFRTQSTIAKSLMLTSNSHIGLTTPENKKELASTKKIQIRIDAKSLELLKIQALCLVTTLEIIDHIIRNGSDSLEHNTLDHEARLRTHRLPLGADHLTTGLGICLELVVLGFPQAELLCATGWLHMLHTDMDPLADDATINLTTNTSLNRVNYISRSH